MRTNRALVAVPTALLSVGLVAGCGGSSKSASSATSSAKAAGSSATSSAGASAGASSGSSDSGSSATASCPTSNTRSFAKTRFVSDIGLTAGTFHRYIYKPYQAGDFKKGQVKKMSVAKAALAAGADYKLLKNASENAKANPTLCKKVAGPISDAMSKLKNVDKKQLLSGNVGDLAGAESSLSSIMKGSKDSGNPITENDSLSKAQSAMSSN